MTDEHPLVESSAAEAIHTANVAAEAAERAREARMTAYRQETQEMLSETLRDVFGEHASSGRFIDVSRIPLLCKSVMDTNERMKRIEELISNQIEANKKRDEDNAKKFVNQDQFQPVQRVVYGGVSLILVAVIGAIVALVVKK